MRIFILRHRSMRSLKDVTTAAGTHVIQQKCKQTQLRE